MDGAEAKAAASWSEGGACRAGERPPAFFSELPTADCRARPRLSRAGISEATLRADRKVAEPRPPPPDQLRLSLATAPRDRGACGGGACPADRRDAVDGSAGARTLNRLHEAQRSGGGRRASGSRRSGLLVARQ